jgi:2-succinyl-5-enolpyruvyl-6-hydroxy-3-cyclohexene-1-carboxylate synthase
MKRPPNSAGSEAMAELPLALDRNPAVAASQTLFAALVSAGLSRVVICPGSRSAPLAVAAARTPGLARTVHVDERSAAFFALGCAKASREPVALVCTSGTAAANFLPAIAEARYAGVPLVALTADRPPELRGVGAGQTIDQVELYGSHARFFAEAPVPREGAAALREMHALAQRALAAALGPPSGPVHLNLPFREPLEPAGPDERTADRAAHSCASTPIARRVAAPSAGEIEALCELVARHERGVIACGPLDPSDADVEAIADLSRAACWPLLADPLSQLRSGDWISSAPVIATSDLWLRDATLRARFAPDCVLRIGASPTSKAFRLWLEAQPPRELVLVDPEHQHPDPSALATRVWHCDAGALCAAAVRRLRRARRGAWVARWERAEAAAERALRLAFASDDECVEPNAVRALLDELPDGAQLVVSNSMPVREVDAFLPTGERALRVLGNRGANGIDGLVSTALGASHATRQPTLLLCGDLAFLHDAGGLLAAQRLGISLVIAALDNDGGGIFSYLPIAAQGEGVYFEELFRTPHGADLAGIAAAYGAHAVRVESLAHLRDALKDAFTRRGVSLLHVPVDRDRSVAVFRARIEEALSAVAQAEPEAAR